MYAIAYTARMDAISSTDLRKNLSKVLDRVTEQHERVIVTRSGEEPAIILSLQEFNRLDLGRHLVASEAVDANVSAALKRADGKGQYISHEAMSAWITSWGNDDEGAPPSADVDLSK